MEINKDSEVKAAAKESEVVLRKTSSVRNPIDYDKIVAVKSESEGDEMKAEIVKVMEEKCKEKGFSLHRALCCLRTRRTS